MTGRTRGHTSDFYACLSSVRLLYLSHLSSGQPVGLTCVQGMYRLACLVISDECTMCRLGTKLAGRTVV